MRPVRAGEPVRFTLDTGTVVSISKIVSHKRSGDAGRHLRCERLPTSSEVLSGVIDVRQRSDGGVHQERGGHEIVHFDADDHKAAQVLQQQGDYVGFRPSARSAQHPGGFPVQSRPETDHGVDDGHGESTTRVCQVGRATDRLVYDIHQQTTRQVRIAVSGPQGGVDRYHVHALGLREGPSCTRSRHSRWSRKYCRRSLSHQEWRWFWSLNCNRQHHGSQSWWTFPKKIPSRCSSKVKTYWHKTFGWETGWLRIVTSDRQIYKRGNSPGHPESIGSFQGSCQHDVKVYLRESSQQVYESHWSRFVAFCRTKRWQVFRVRSHHLNTYMMHLFRDGLLPSTLFSHRTSVASVLRHWVYDPAANPHIKLLVRAFRLERPVQRRIMPKWGLHLVLSLLRPPFISQIEVHGNPWMTSFP